MGSVKPSGRRGRKRLSLNILPEAPDRKAIEQGFTGNRHHAFAPNPREQEAVKEVLAGNVHCPGEPGMPNADGRLTETLPGK
ncbi:hypothetical protein [Novosphingobium sediminicola]|uniref:Uncharacterized protein n=1 Tax=Novosphingobium sediminicola TaxID=563162 RepID=A0A7W6CJM8_9SPHN|nr:hypothetical protein [Novosphingobium sediminicola]MBB3957704.1 hypothetical protein [Novosphingobium sediminicola]